MTNLLVMLIYAQTTTPAAIMRLLYYPPQTGTVDDRVMGIGAHTELSPCLSITTLYAHMRL
jgi:hypothetical protein